MAKGKKASVSDGKRTRIIISIIYIIAGGASLIPAIGLLSKLDLYTLIDLAGSALMLVTGILGLFDIKKPACRILGIILFCLFAVPLVLKIIDGGDLDTQLLVKALISWLFITVV